MLLQTIAPAVPGPTGAPLRALVIEVEGPLFDTGELHRGAFNDALERVGLPWACDEPAWVDLGGERGDEERFLRLRGRRSLRSALAVDAEIRTLVRLKDDALARRVLAGCAVARPGAAQLLAAAREAGLRLAIASAVTPALLDLLLDAGFGPGARAGFDVVEDLGSAPRGKPDPQACLQAVRRLGLQPGECLAIEGSADGLRAAAAAGLAAVMVPGRYQVAHAFGGSPRVLRGLASVDVARLRGWHGQVAAH